MMHHNITLNPAQAEWNTYRQNRLREKRGNKKGERSMFEGFTVAARFMARQILNQIQESVLHLPPTGSC